ncbi:hypothetical protein RB195_002157 [Necator americanus]|uniref:Uncharacterized protein n=1 Tax=Necator americanus TaxID=51031 RepID=A0ABR1DHM3_NECAM
MGEWEENLGCDGANLIHVCLLGQSIFRVLIYNSRQLTLDGRVSSIPFSLWSWEKLLENFTLLNERMPYRLSQGEGSPNFSQRFLKGDTTEEKTLDLKSCKNKRGGEARRSEFTNSARSRQEITKLSKGKCMEHFAPA